MAKGRTRANRHLSKQEMDMLLDYSDLSTPAKYRNTILIHLLAGTGLKVYEAIELMVSDVNYLMNYLYAGRGRKRRWIPMDKRTKPLIEDYITEYRLRLRPQCDNLLVTYLGHPFARDSLLRTVKATGRIVGIDSLTSELIRYSFTFHLHGRATIELFLERTGIHASTLDGLDIPEKEIDLAEVMKKYHPRH